MKFLSAVILLISLTTSCSNQSENKPIPYEEIKATEEVHLKVFLNKNGVILCNNIEVELEKLDLKFEELKSNKGVVYYSRANPAREISDKSMQIVDLIAKHQLPIKFFTDDSFSTPIQMK